MVSSVPGVFQPLLNVNLLCIIAGNVHPGPTTDLPALWVGFQV